MAISTTTTVTFAAVIDRAQVAINDELAATWDDEILATYLNEAIRDYSQHFPRIMNSGASELAAGTNITGLNPMMFGIISVEYPDGDDPPTYLVKRPYTHPDFWTVDGYYDLILRGDDDNARPPQLVLSGTIVGGESYVMEFYGSHELIDDVTSISGNCTVPPHHQLLLIKFIRWQTTLHLLSAEQQSPTSNSSLLMAQLAQNARRDQLAYDTALQQAIYASDGPSRLLNWVQKGSGVERIY